MLACAIDLKLIKRYRFELCKSGDILNRYDIYIENVATQHQAGRNVKNTRPQGDKGDERNSHHSNLWAQFVAWEDIR